MPHMAAGDFSGTVDSVADMPSVSFEGPLPKLASWLSWLEKFAFRITELRGLTAVLAFYAGLEPHRRWKMAAGGTAVMLRTGRALCA